MFKFSTEGMANELERQRHGKQKGQKTCNLVISLKPFLSNQNVNVANAFLFENTFALFQIQICGQTIPDGLAQRNCYLGTG